MSKKRDVNNVDGGSNPPRVRVIEGFREMESADGSWSKKGAFTDKYTGEKYKRNYPAKKTMMANKKGEFYLNPSAYSVLNRGDKSNKAVDPMYKGNVKGDRMVARLAALKSMKAKKGK